LSDQNVTGSKTMFKVGVVSDKNARFRRTMEVLVATEQATGAWVGVWGEKGFFGFFAWATTKRPVH